ITVVLAVVLLEERVRIYRWTAVCVGLLGVLIVLWPHLGGAVSSGRESMGALLALAAAAGAALAMIQVRRLTSTEHSSTIVFYFSAFSALIGLLTLPLGWTVPSATDAAVLVMIGLLGGVGQLLLTESYRHADASLIAPFEYTTILWATVLGYAMFGDVASPLVAVGSGVVIAAGIFVIFRERRLGLERGRARQASGPPGSP
ncbi:MAG: DMT family transporter, partial [Pseudomonadota bacterium]|nr:DMT family transporter [Pseudomonadota bacterium]